MQLIDVVLFWKSQVEIVCWFSSLNPTLTGGPCAGRIPDWGTLHACCCDEPVVPVEVSYIRGLELTNQKIDMPHTEAGDGPMARRL